MDFIFMLTRDDQTVADCLEIFAEAEALGLEHVGFKDIGVERDTLDELNRRIQASGAKSYLEVVSTSKADCLSAARTAVELGVDRLLGGIEAEPVLEILAGSEIEYLPFPGRPEGHPTRLGGSPRDVVADCRRFEALGCAGVDLLAYRAIDHDPLGLVRAARAAIEGTLVVAGSIDSPQRIADLAEAGADAFTIGTAVLDGSFDLSRDGIAAQLDAVLAACGKTPHIPG